MSRWIIIMRTNFWESVPPILETKNVSESASKERTSERENVKNTKNIRPKTRRYESPTTRKTKQISRGFSRGTLFYFCEAVFENDESPYAEPFFSQTSRFTTNTPRHFPPKRRRSLPPLRPSDVERNKKWRRGRNSRPHPPHTNITPTQTSIHKHTQTHTQRGTGGTVMTFGILLEPCTHSHAPRGVRTPKGTQVFPLSAPLPHSSAVSDGPNHTLCANCKSQLHTLTRRTVHHTHKSPHKQSLLTNRPLRPKRKRQQYSLCRTKDESKATSVNVQPLPMPKAKSHSQAHR